MLSNNSLLKPVTPDCRPNKVDLPLRERPFRSLRASVTCGRSNSYPHLHPAGSTHESPTVRSGSSSIIAVHTTDFDLVKKRAFVVLIITRSH